MTPFQSINRCLLKKYASIRGRASLSEFWWFVLYFFAGDFVLAAICTSLCCWFHNATVGILLAEVVIGIWSLFHLVPLFCVLVRRFHDCNHSFFNLLWFIIPLYFPIYVFVVTLKAGTPATNKQGYPYPLIDIPFYNLLWFIIPLYFPFYVFVVTLKAGTPAINKYGYPYPLNDTPFSKQDFYLLRKKLTQAKKEIYGITSERHKYDYIPLNAIPLIQKWEALNVE